MNVRVEVSAAAQADTRLIARDLAARSSLSLANDYLRHFEAVYDRLAAFPQIGAPRPKLGKDLRTCLVKPYLIFYRYMKSEQTVAIVRVLHERRSISSHLLSGR